MSTPPPNHFRITFAQLNPTVGHFSGNSEKIVAAWQQGHKAGAGLVALPEMFITGYQVQDLVMKPAFTRDAMSYVEKLAKECANGPALGIGHPWMDEDGALYNAYSILREGRVVARVLKHELPNTGVFDEKRVYHAGEATDGVVSLEHNGTRLKIGIPICEDAWHGSVSAALRDAGADVLLVPNGSPYYREKHAVRIQHMRARVAQTNVPLLYLNMVGGQDDQMFDGGSFVLNPGGDLSIQLPVFDEHIAHIDLTSTAGVWRAVDGEKPQHPDVWEQDYRAMVETLRDYMRKTGFQKVLLGMSGGVDSALVATIAADALGPQNIRCVMMPSEYTSKTSLDDASDAAQRLGARLDTIAISEPRAAVTEALAPLFSGLKADVTEENIQSRLRGLLLMALSNKFGEMLLTTGNKSEVAVGYATIYGDMSGGYNPLKDLYKTRVFETCRWRNDNHRDWMLGPGGKVIPARIIEKPPSAELREDQKDEDSLPPYPVLDDILERLIDKEQSVAEVVGAGHPREVVKRIEHLIYISEYKRFQSAPGTRLSDRAFWLDRRYPIVNRWRDNS